MSLSRGTRLGPYEIIALIGVGGMGEVYRARDTRLDRIVAIKMLHRTAAVDPKLRLRVEHEAGTVAAISHPHICALYDVGREGEIDYFVMEFLKVRRSPTGWRGGCCRSILRSGAVPSRRRPGRGASAWGIHRDLKPANIMLTREGAKLLDFGIATLRAEGDGALAATLDTSRLRSKGGPSQTPSSGHSTTWRPNNCRDGQWTRGLISSRSE